MHDVEVEMHNVTFAASTCVGHVN